MAFIRSNPDFLFEHPRLKTISATEISTGWTELRTIKNKAQVWSVSALKDIVNSLPFQVIAIHSDNGSEFINAHLKNFWAQPKRSIKNLTSPITTNITSRRQYEIHPFLSGRFISEERRPQHP